MGFLKLVDCFKLECKCTLDDLMSVVNSDKNMCDDKQVLFKQHKLVDYLNAAITLFNGIVCHGKVNCNNIAIKLKKNANVFYAYLRPK